jgi:rRNA-processing protein FCF1
MADFIERLREIHDEDINLFIIIHVVDELYKLSFARSKFVML